MEIESKHDFEEMARQLMEVWLRGDEYRRRRFLEVLGMPAFSRLSSSFFNDQQFAVDLKTVDFKKEQEMLVDKIEKRIFKLIAESRNNEEAFFAILKCWEEEMPGYSFSFYIYNDELVNVYSIKDSKTFFSVRHLRGIETGEDAILMPGEDNLDEKCGWDDEELPAAGYKYAGRVPLCGFKGDIGFFKWFYRNESMRAGDDVIKKVIGDISPALEMMLERNRLDSKSREREKERDSLWRRFNLIGDIAVNIAHEIRNPMTTIKGLAQMLMLDNPENASYYNMMIEEIDRADGIIKNFLHLSRDIITEEEEIEINSLLDLVLISLGDEFLSRQVRIVRDYDVNRLRIWADQNQMREAWRNILYNALEASSPGDTIKIEIGKKDSWACIVFTDEGEGIAEADLKKVMEPFFTTKGNNTGLGLSISYKIIKEHGGDMKLYSKLGKGTKVEVYLPVVR